MSTDPYPPRPSEDEWLLRMAETTAQRSTCSRLAVGAVLAWNGRILSTGYNGAPVGEEHCEHHDDAPCTRSVHAEVNALLFAARHGVSTEHATLYLTHAPCYACAGLIINAGIVQVRFRHFYRSDTGMHRLSAAGIYTYGGV